MTSKISGRVMREDLELNSFVPLAEASEEYRHEVIKTVREETAAVLLRLLDMAMLRRLEGATRTMRVRAGQLKRVVVTVELRP